MAEPPAPEKTHVATIAKVVDGIKANEHAKVLIVGCRGDNFPDDPWRRHPQLVFWEGDDTLTKEVPAAVRLILVTRFLGHHSYGKLLKTSQQRNIMFGTKTMGTGEIKDILRPLVVTTAAPPAPRVIQAAPSRAAVPERKRRQILGRGVLLNFVRANGDPHAPRFAEAQRLQQLAAASGLKITVASAANALLRLERMGAQATPKAMADIAKQRPGAEPIVAEHGTIPIPPPPAPPAPTPTPVKQQVKALADDDEELQRMLNDVTHALGDVLAAVELVKENIRRRGDSRRRLKELLKEL